jgi:hypothetical protein
VTFALVVPHVPVPHQVPERRGTLTRCRDAPRMPYWRLAELLVRLGDDDWERVGVREGVDLSVAWMAVNTLHEARHHLVDIERATGDADNG